MNTHTWFSMPIDSEPQSKIFSVLQTLGFKGDNAELIDAQDRRVILSLDAPNEIKIGVPASDVLEEQEQLEFVLGHLGLDIDKVQEV
jgi:hypothetical protein